MFKQKETDITIKFGQKPTVTVQGVEIKKNRVLVSKDLCSLASAFYPYAKNNASMLKVHKRIQNLQEQHVKKIINEKQGYKECQALIAFSDSGDAFIAVVVSDGRGYASIMTYLEKDAERFKTIKGDYIFDTSEYVYFEFYRGVEFFMVKEKPVAKKTPSYTVSKNLSSDAEKLKNLLAVKNKEFFDTKGKLAAETDYNEAVKLYEHCQYLEKLLVEIRDRYADANPDYAKRRMPVKPLPAFTDICKLTPPKKEEKKVVYESREDELAAMIAKKEDKIEKLKVMRDASTDFDEIRRIDHRLHQLSGEVASEKHILATMVNANKPIAKPVVKPRPVLRVLKPNGPIAA
ncbi:hypothetical protein [Escherichia coli]|uniref:hypothetical protein n=1 Tax=Escherichia coli TaxID=562 RepID=UPI000B3E997F|nr:hypothetical protein [Escherichia coli]EFF7976211.1 hypothetical protein [Escherichia coli]EFI2836360.1 hypothetical protein [Escherichia coli]